MIPLLLLSLIPTLLWDQPEPPAAAVKAGFSKIAVPEGSSPGAESFAKLHVDKVDPGSLEKLDAPGVDFKMNQASATRAPWLRANGWKISRQPGRSYLYDAEGQAAALAAAEGFAYDAKAYITTDAKGLEPLARMLQFLRDLPPFDAPPVANIGFLDDGSERSGEILNLLARRNLLYRVVKQRDPKLDLFIDPASYSAKEAANPSEFAAKVRKDLTDAKRLVRIYGSDVVLARLEGERGRRRLHLLNYSGSSRPVEGIRVRVLGKYAKAKPNVFGEDSNRLLDFLHDGNATEFTLPRLSLYAVVDLWE